MLLRFPHLGRRHHLHRLGDLRRVANRLDSTSYVLSVGHLRIADLVPTADAILAVSFSNMKSNFAFWFLRLSQQLPDGLEQVGNRFVMGIEPTFELGQFHS